MVSKYGYITLAELELAWSEDYSAIDATELADAKVDAKITLAEETINGYVDADAFTGTIPDAIISATKIISVRLIYRWMREQGMELSKEDLLEAAKPLLDADDIIPLLSEYKSKETTTVWWV